MQDSRYTSLSTTEDYQPHSGVFHKPSRWGFDGKRTYLLLAAAGLLYIYPFIHTVQSLLLSDSAPSAFAQVDLLRTTWKEFHWNTEYSPQNHSDADQLWAAINPAHGIIAVDRQWAAQNHWPESMTMPDDDSKGVYLLEAYHQLHCLVSLRFPNSNVVFSIETFDAW
ncbi:hypothetical protein AtubIFM56815_004980 [Aspergillus tubingensis]|uniref:Uncharacterized protein n=1 Tax=Aspergillus tubingensis TaxID=5068 RepID=A0A9W6AI92_ASPTU|nr:hypothetical protein AtubIFM56815_004980 [Aspergillus tubingensis]